MKIHHRKILPEIEKCLNIPEIIVIHGARQTGKTTILNILVKKLNEKINPANIIYFDLEDFELIDLCNSGVNSVIEHLKAIGCNFEQKIFLFIDEIQYLENPSSFLKYFYDHWKGNVKLIVSGSSTFAIKSKFSAGLSNLKESLVGRTIDFELFGLDFEEFLIFKNITYDLKTHDKIIIEKLRKLFKEFVFYGNYPRIVLEDSIEIKKRLLKQIINTYLKKDVKDLSRITDINKFNRLLKILASQSGSLLNILELANTVGISRPTLENYLIILENTYVIRLVPPFYQNVRSELTKMPKIYFEDLGIKNILEKGDFSLILSGQDFETAIYSILRKNCDIEYIRFWRTVKKEEIDFIVESPKELLAYEVKINVRNKDKFILDKFKKHYPTAKTYLVGLDFIDKSMSDDVNFIYPWQIVNNVKN